MRDSLTVVLALGLTFDCSIAAAQIQPIPEQQLAVGFLGEQNARLTSQEAPSDASFATRAAAALAERDYSRALAILRPYRRDRSIVYFFLAGQAHQGLGDYDAARRDYSEAVRQDRAFVGAQLALGLLEIEYGERTSAEAVLTSLTRLRERCAESCSSAADLANAISIMTSALRSAQP